ncbi:hypothetical protein QVN83_02570 [Yersinia frederiksenii]|nr:hypothetical protein [Yersinia frederiksenii]MDN0117863.1 hypothetical protein [Yersinia frederiksenii]
MLLHELGLGVFVTTQQVILHDWLTDIGITHAEQLDISTVPSIIRLQRWEVGVFRA